MHMNLNFLYIFKSGTFQINVCKSTAVLYRKLWINSCNTLNVILGISVKLHLTALTYHNGANISCDTMLGQH